MKNTITRLNIGQRVHDPFDQHREGFYNLHSLYESGASWFPRNRCWGRAIMWIAHFGTWQAVCGFVLATLLLTACGGDAARGDGILTEPLEANTEVLADGFVNPYAIAVINENEYLITERVAGLYHYVDGELTELGGIPDSEIFDSRGTIVGGVMDVSLHPDFASNGFVYLAYLDMENTMSVARFNFADREVEDVEVIFDSDFGSIGSAFAWQDADHFFVSQGITSLEAGQDLTHDGGTIHRLTADGSVPDDNPVFDGFDGPTSIWSYGHRVNQGLLVDGGVLYATEHGDSAGDEFNVIEGGANYGWPNITSGRFRDGNPPAADDGLLASAIDPLVTWPTVTLAPTGLMRVNNSNFPELDGRFLTGALVATALVSIDVDTAETSILIDDTGRVRDIDQLPGGDLIMAVEAPLTGPPNGQIVRLSPAG